MDFNNIVNNPKNQSMKFREVQSLLHSKGDNDQSEEAAAAWEEILLTVLQTEASIQKIQRTFKKSIKKPKYSNQSMG